MGHAKGGPVTDGAQVKIRQEVEIHLVPDTAKQVMEIRIWCNDKMVHSVALSLAEFRVHFSSFPNIQPGGVDMAFAMC